MSDMVRSMPVPNGYAGVIVSKPWGYEYLMYQNARVALWYLRIHAGKQTSLHCHPRKKTGLVLLSGEAAVSYLNDSVRLKALSRVMIRPGLFHSTMALSAEGIVMLEIESPPQKDDLVRLDDVYGRKEQPYEGVEAISPATDECISLELPEKGQSVKYDLYGCTLSIEFVQDLAETRHRKTDDVIIVLEGGLFNKGNDEILGPGDVVTPSTLVRLSGSFAVRDGIYLLTIREAS